MHTFTSTDNGKKKKAKKANFKKKHQKKKPVDFVLRAMTAAL
jgi:hypothetical protein